MNGALSDPIPWKDVFKLTLHPLKGFMRQSRVQGRVYNWMIHKVSRVLYITNDQSWLRTGSGAYGLVISQMRFRSVFDEKIRDF